MSRIGEHFTASQSQGRKTLIAYIMAGDPQLKATVPLMHALVRAGADIIELGMPFSDPSADGPVIQAASERSLANGTTLTQVIAMVGEFRRQDQQTPVVLMGYLNPVERMGYADFAQVAKQAGADGALIVDVPPEESGDLTAALRAAGLDPIFLLSPTTSAQRIQRICAEASGFVYYVSLKGVTGAASLDLSAVSRRIAEIRGITDLPVGVGFGIGTAEAAAEVARFADAVVVGSALVSRFAEVGADSQSGLRQAELLINAMRQAMDAVARSEASIRMSKP